MTYIRKTRDVYEIQGNYNYGHGWEAVNTETTRQDAKRSLKEYRENEPNTSFRRVCKRERIKSDTEEII